MTCRPVLTTKDLMREFADWGESNRNYFDLRFGQAMHSKYHLVPDVAFYTEDKTEAFNELLEALKDYQR